NSVSARATPALASVVFFLPAEDGIGVGHVTGVRSCALPFSTPSPRMVCRASSARARRGRPSAGWAWRVWRAASAAPASAAASLGLTARPPALDDEVAQALARQPLEGEHPVLVRAPQHAGNSEQPARAQRASGRDGRRVVLGSTDFQHERAVGAEEAADVPALGLVGESPDRAGPEVGTAGQEVAQQSPARVRLEQVAERAELGVLGEERDRDGLAWEGDSPLPASRRLGLRRVLALPALAPLGHGVEVERAPQRPGIRWLGRALAACEPVADEAF